MAKGDNGRKQIRSYRRETDEDDDEDEDDCEEGELSRLRGFEGYVNRKSFKINPSA